MQTETSQIPPSARILQLATAGWMSAAVSAAAELGVADELARGPRTVEDIAKSIDADAPTLYRLLRACADFGLFREEAGRVFALTETGEALRSDAPGSMRNFARWVGEPADRFTWSRLAESVLTGRSAFAAVHGRSVWEYLREETHTARVFNGAMTEASSGLIAPVVNAYDFSSFRKIVDVGGGQGALLAAVLAANPDAQGVLFDQPEVIAAAGRAFEDAGVADRVEKHRGDFFESVPAGGDAYLMSNIIHDWDDEHSVRILANCRAAMTADARVLLVEAVMPSGPAHAPTVKLMDLNMLVLCDGRQRTEDEFRALFREAGLELSRVVPGGLCSVVEAVRA
ncbi:acetylserotonin O-methyltransferase [Streptomyces sp. RerS4]|uniref:acetylserotonin O-methyltransferase n=1 Tax=Streptomyces sp. RerS4 TaxID=2942449 RepID=UPI00201CACE2|nr:acetylserotonin O-methyltransferase [Streptomyces sp. RerS4]UQX03450.1 acetylserotonin O-methyltransferase [Streptomyces sp. RerS4]